MGKVKANAMKSPGLKNQATEEVNDIVIFKMRSEIQCGCVRWTSVNLKKKSATQDRKFIKIPASYSSNS